MSPHAMTLYAVLGTLYLLLTAWALFNVLGSGARREQKVLWTALLLLFPLLGLFNWAWMGPRRLHR
ncbi:PLDc N-terminal domain-containing protein [Pseudomonas solani]|uniref:PLDc N-terminal domain-containing protein n=1 Tax=Pseudomonas solani TaxID=2731552 RepID=UPI0035BE5E46